MRAIRRIKVSNTNRVFLCIIFFASTSFFMGCSKSNDNPSTVVDTPTPETPTTPKKYRVFVTSTLHNGNLGGLTGGDSICAARATAAGMTGTWKAWLSDSTTDAISRIADHAPWYTPDESTVVISSYSLLSTPASTVPIVIDESGNDLSSSGNAVLTATNASGVKVANQHCSNWTDSSNGGNVRVGAINGSGSFWTTGVADFCDSISALYCFEQ